MEIARLVLEYLQALAWPGITITAILIFRKQLRQLLANIGSAVHRVKKFTAPGTTIELINELSQKVEQIDVLPSQKRTPTITAPWEMTRETTTSRPPTRDRSTPKTPASDTPTRDTPTPKTPASDTPTRDTPTPETHSRYIEVEDVQTPTWIEKINLDDLMRGTIIRIWNEIDASLSQLAAVEAPWSDYKVRHPGRRNPMANVDLLRGRGIITEDSAESLIAARRIRNAVVHEMTALPLSSFDEYLRTISRLNEYLKNLCELI